MDLIKNEFNLHAQEESYNSGGWNFTNFDETSDSSNFSLDFIETFSGFDDTSSESEFSDRECFITFEERFSFSSLSNLPKKSSSLLDESSGRFFTANRSSCPQEQPEASNLSISSSSTRQFFLPSENANDFMDLAQQVPDSDTEEIFNSENMLDPLQQISSHSKQQKNTNCHSQKPSTENFETALQQSVSQSLLQTDLQLSNRAELSMSSDVENSTVQLFSKQPPRKKTKKRKVYQKNVPDNAYFTIVCDYCFYKQQFKATYKHNIVSSFKRHLKNEHPGITKEQIRNYINQHLQEPEQPVKFSVDCPESECKHIAHSFERSQITENLFLHVSKKHPKNKGNCSRESVATYVGSNWKKILVPVQKKLKKSNFTIVCSFCSRKPQFQSRRKDNLTRSFKNHMEREHQNITERETIIYIDQHLQEPELLVNFSIYCPEPKCQDILYSSRKSDLKNKLFNHMRNQHKKEIDYLKGEFSTYVKDNCKRTLVSAQE